MPQRRGDVILFDRPPAVDAWAAVGGKKEGEGPLAAAVSYTHLTLPTICSV